MPLPFAAAGTGLVTVSVNLFALVKAQFSFRIFAFDVSDF